MVGSILTNCWMAIISFSIYFLFTFQKANTPSSVIISAFIVAIIAFFLTYALRYLIGYITYTPDDNLVTSMDSHTMTSKKEENQPNTKELTEENSEEIARIVKTMLDRD